jgi:HEPN domain-containing protein
MSLYSWDYPDDHGPPGWFRRARAYIEASLHLFRAIEAGELPMTYHHAQSAAFLFAHSLETFLKGAVLSAGKPLKRGHSLGRLYGAYTKEFSGQEYAFTGAIEDLVKDDPWPPNEFLRYPVDSNGHPWLGNSHFDLGIWTNQVERFEADYRRLESAILQRGMQSRAT